MAKIGQYLQQVDDKLIAEKPCVLTIQLNDYHLSNTIEIKESENIIWAKSLISKVEFDNIFFNIILDYPVELQTQNMKKEDNQIILSYIKGDVILTVPFTTVEIKEQVNYVKRLLGGRELYKDPTHLLKKIYNVYGEISDLDLVHLEVLSSQVLRDKNDPSIPARLGATWNPVMANIKTDVFNTGFIQGLAFENVGKAIDTGLTTSIETEPSVMEKIVTGTLIPQKKKY